MFIILLLLLSLLLHLVNVLLGRSVWEWDPAGSSANTLTRTLSSPGTPKLSQVTEDFTTAEIPEYDVFLSFRGEDTRNNFTDHLYHGLVQKGIKTFRDEERLEMGKPIAPNLLEAIEASKFAVVVLSKNYASSTWCLEELNHIVECMKKGRLQVFPVFCHVEPSEVRKQTGKYGEAFAKHEQNLNSEKRKVREWRRALRKVANVAGSDLKNKKELEVIRDIANKISNALKSYIDAAFRSSRKNEAYLFMKNEYVRLDYAPGTADDRVIYGPLPICKGYPSLAGTDFGEYGIDCAFGCNNGDEAFIFYLNLCAQINYAPDTPDDKIIKGPMTITVMFPFFRNTVFESGIDAAFESTREYEAYLFKGNRYACINYGPNPHLITNRFIDGFPSLKSTIFESGIDAAFASHRVNEAYLFKGDSYARINFAPGTTEDYIIGGIKKIHHTWSSLSSILPRKNRGLDVHYHNKPEDDTVRDHDEL